MLFFVDYQHAKIFETNAIAKQRMRADDNIHFAFGNPSSVFLFSLALVRRDICRSVKGSRQSAR